MRLQQVAQNRGCMIEKIKNMLKTSEQLARERQDIEAKKQNEIAEAKAQAERLRIQGERQRENDLFKLRDANREAAAKVEKRVAGAQRDLDELVKTAQKYKHNQADPKFKMALAAVKNSQAVVHAAREVQLGIALGALKIEFLEMQYDHLQVRKNNLRIAELHGNTEEQREIYEDLRAKEREFDRQLIRLSNASASGSDPLPLPDAMTDEEAMKLIDGADMAATVREHEELSRLRGFHESNSDQIRRAT